MYQNEENSFFCQVDHITDSIPCVPFFHALLHEREDRISHESLFPVQYLATMGWSPKFLTHNIGQPLDNFREVFHGSTSTYLWCVRVLRL